MREAAIGLAAAWLCHDTKIEQSEPLHRYGSDGGGFVRASLAAAADHASSNFEPDQRHESRRQLP